MKNRIIIVLLLSLLSTHLPAHTYVPSSVLGSGRFVKIQVSSSGLYGISYEQLKSWGLNPQTIRVLGYGGNLIPQNFTLPRTDDVPSIPFYMHTGSDGIFNAGDYILFYANGPVGWEWSGSSFTRTRNCYADYGCYFLSDNAGEQLLMTESEPITDEAPYSVYDYTALQLHEIEQCNLLDIQHGKEGGGREWYGEVLTPTDNKLTVPFTFQDVDTERPLFCRVDAAANSGVNTTMQVELEGVTRSCIFNGIDVGDFYTRAKAATATIATAVPTGNTLAVKLTYQSTSSSAMAYLNYVDMQVSCRLHLRGNSLMIRNTENVGDPTPSLYHLTGADASTQIWNMTNPAKATRVPTTWKGDTLCWMGDNSAVQFFIAVRTSAKTWSTPAYCGTVPNQNLHRDLRGKQHIIITPEELRPAAEQLKRAHEQHSNQQWWVVSDQEVFNEFSSGTPDASAFRWMMKYLYDSFQSPDSAPQSLLLFGDGSFDNRQLLKTSAPPTLLTYQAINSLVETDAYATDDYFGFLDDNSCLSGNRWSDQLGQMRISVGRLPVNTYEEAEGVVAKISNFMQDANAGSWKQQLCFLADDGDHGTHVRVGDAAAELVRKNNPAFAVNKIYLDSYEQEATASGESYPVAYNRYVNMLQSGVSLMDYSGHGSANNICSEMFLTRKQVEAMNNTNQGVWMLATCSFAHFDQTEQSTAELAMLNPNGGAIAVISSDRTVYATENEKINNYFCQELFQHSDPFTYPNTIGEALRIAKNKNGSNMNKLPYVLLGDPSLALNYPTQYQVIVSDMPDTLRALDLITVHGYVGDTLNASRPDTANFTGRVYITVYDKMQYFKTRDNDEPEEDKKQIIDSICDYSNKIFVGETDVENGKFTFSFRVPKDIRYNIASGRMIFYALGNDEQGKSEALGYHEQFKVGGSLPWTIDDKNGPDIQMYLNTPLFHDGDEVNNAPHFFADLYDENGINTIGSGIGHDLLLVLDNDMKKNYVLNNYYTSENNSYQRGNISYILPEMSDGYHTLSFRAWDLLNNATTRTLGFTVNGDLGPVIKSLMVYPNPVSSTGTLYMQMQNDRPDDMLSIHICFYDMVGHNVWSTTQTIDGETISLSMSDATLPPGTYIYQFTIQTATQSSKRQTGRLIVY
ncbi:MAG: type IX secretion system sortase PorU [Paludibacteraceae bacterium]|nr:type IX secretion system sortase PorU [Paludibacteraceae bacterium]